MNLKEIHAKCFKNKEALDKSKTAGCFHCLTVFPATALQEWTDDGQTALCPHCGIDSVLPDSEVGLSEDLLREMRRIYFEMEYVLRLDALGYLAWHQWPVYRKPGVSGDEWGFVG